MQLVPHARPVDSSCKTSWQTHCLKTFLLERNLL